MLEVFTKLADWSIAQMGLTLDTHFGQAVHFFIEDTTKIFFLIYVLIFFISLFRSQLSPEKVREYLSGKSKWYGYLLAVFLGVVTPFCSCSSIPLFMGFIAAGVPFGVAIAFLVSSPLISEIAAIMLLSMEGAGWYVAGVYILTGTVISVLAGWLADKFNIERFLAIKIDMKTPQTCGCTSMKEKAVALIKYANGFAMDTIKSIGLYILIGLVIGAFMHGYIPQELFVKYLGADNLFAVPLASVIGIPLYTSHAGVVPIIQVLLMKGVPVGTALVMLMSLTAISLPEMIMLKKVFTYKLLAIFTGFLLVAFIITGYILNAL
ncbi:MAG: permease [Alphaproteobacteria bacterium]|nr:permease [Alphaproteobacteria bacterium]